MNITLKQNGHVINFQYGTWEHIVALAPLLQDNFDIIVEVNGEPHEQRSVKSAEEMVTLKTLIDASYPGGKDTNFGNPEHADSNGEVAVYFEGQIGMLRNMHDEEMPVEKIKAVKLIRELTTCGLMEAKGLNERSISMSLGWHSINDATEAVRRFRSYGYRAWFGDFVDGQGAGAWHEFLS